jgi:formylglycine-generating enzyme required for sulfatase activity
MNLPSSFVDDALGEGPLITAEMISASTERLFALLGSDEPAATRYSAGLLLALRGDPRLDPFRPQMLAISGGKVRLGLKRERVDDVVAHYAHVGVRRDWIEKEVPEYEAELAPFAIARHPVTNGEYRVFLLETDYPELPSSWYLGRFPHDRANHPVFTVSSEAAEAYARWLSRRTGRHFRLPTEAEWEYAAAGPEQREFPWGDAFLPLIANTCEARFLGTTPVGMFTAGQSWCGAQDMCGNVEEIVADCYRPYPGGRWIDDDLTEHDPAYRMTRGGSFTRNADLGRTRRRHGYFPDNQLYPIGFRLAEMGAMST